MFTSKVKYDFPVKDGSLEELRLNGDLSEYHYFFYITDSENFKHGTRLHIIVEHPIVDVELARFVNVSYSSVENWSGELVNIKPFSPVSIRYQHKKPR